MRSTRWITISLTLLIAASTGWFSSALAQSSRQDAPSPYKRMMEDPLDFSGYDVKTIPRTNQNGIPLGLYAPGASSGRPGRCLYQGAQLALEEINAQKGFNGHPLILIRRWAEDPWNAGSREMLRLAYTDHVLAVIGFLSDSSHIAEQIATKAYLPIVTPISSDPSLTHARVPWIFRLPPDDAAQAGVMIDQGLIGNGFRSPGLITGTDQDSRMAESRILSALKNRRTPPLFHLKLPANMVNYEEIVDKIKTFKPDSLILRLPPSAVTQLAARLNRAGLAYPMLMPWIPGLDFNELRLNRMSPLILVEPFDRSEANQAFRIFSKTYFDRFGEKPSFSAAYAYDATHLLAQAFQAGGLSRKGVRDALAAQGERSGVTGPIRWDNGGGNLAKPVIRYYPVPIQRTSWKSESSHIH